jgi:murein DD-endopeptidase MepM/ murein hydrolase activator NlpD
VDIFAREGTSVVAATSGIVLYSGTMGMGGNVLIILGPHWKLHYYAHLREQHVTALTIVSRNEVIATVGTTGNARGKSPHLHYSIARLIPHPWAIDSDHQGWKKMFYVDPTPQLNAAAD